MNNYFESTMHFTGMDDIIAEHLETYANTTDFSLEAFKSTLDSYVNDLLEDCGPALCQGWLWSQAVMILVETIMYLTGCQNENAKAYTEYAFESWKKLDGLKDEQFDQLIEGFLGIDQIAWSDDLEANYFLMSLAFVD